MTTAVTLRPATSRLRLLAGAVLGASALGAASLAQAEPVTYTLEPTHTQVDFRWQHMGLSSPAASMDKVQGTLVWDAAQPERSSVKVTMPVDGVRTRVPALDDHFKSAEYFDAKSHPNVTFESTEVQRIGVGNQYQITGNLTVKGITKPVVLSAQLNGAATHPMFKAPVVGFDATGTLKRSDFGMREALGMVSDDIQIRITTEAVEAKALAAAMGGK